MFLYYCLDNLWIRGSILYPGSNSKTAEYIMEICWCLLPQTSDAEITPSSRKKRVSPWLGSLEETMILNMEPLQVGSVLTEMTGEVWAWASGCSHLSTEVFCEPWSKLSFSRGKCAFTLIINSPASRAVGKKCLLFSSFCLFEFLLLDRVTWWLTKCGFGIPPLGILMEVVWGMPQELGFLWLFKCCYYWQRKEDVWRITSLV